MSSEFWAKKLAGIATPPPTRPAQTVAPGPWWQEQAPVQQGYGHALDAQMPARPQYSSTAEDQRVQQLRRMPADQLTQDDMELIARWELANRQTHNNACPNCGSGNFAARGTRLGTTVLGSDKCFECGGSSSTSVSSPEPALGGGGRSKAAYRQVRQIDTGGGAGSMYLQFDGTPSSYIPRS